MQQLWNPTVARRTRTDWPTILDDRTRNGFHTKISTAFHQLIYSANVHENFYELLWNRNSRNSENLQSREKAINVSRLFLQWEIFILSVCKGMAVDVCAPCLCWIDPFHLKHEMEPKYIQNTECYSTRLLCLPTEGWTVFVPGIYSSIYELFHQHLLWLSPEYS